MTVAVWRLVQRIKARRAGEQEATVQDARAQLAQGQRQLDASREDRARREAELAGVQGLVDALLDGSTRYRPELMLRRREQLEAGREAVSAAQRTVDRAESQVRTLSEELRAARQHLQLLQQQEKRAAEQLQRALAAIDNAMEDRQDEDSEEAAVARLLAARRAETREPGHA